MTSFISISNFRHLDRDYIRTYTRLVDGMENDAENVKDEELQDIVTRLQEAVSEKTCHLKSLQNQVQTIGEQVQERNKQRQVFISSTTHIHEAVDIVKDHNLLRDTLQAKQAELKSLQEGTTDEQRELERVQEQFDELRNYQSQGLSQREHNTSSLEGMKKQYKELQELCKITETRLENAKQRLAKNKDAERDQKINAARKPLSVRLDHFIAKTCRQAGLQL